MSKRILVISPTPTHPAISGSRARIGMMISKMKAMAHCVHFLHIEREPGDQKQMKNVWGETYHTAAYQRPPKSIIQKIIKKIKVLINSEYRYQSNIDDWWDNSANEVIDSLQREYNFDVVMVEYVFFSKALECFPSSVLKIIDTHDIFSDRHKLYLNKGVKPQWFSTTRKEEKKALDRADLIIAIQDRERNFFTKLTDKPVMTVGHFVQLKPPGNSNLSHKILYVAAKNPINVQSIEWFISEVLTRIRSTVSNSELVIVGNICEIIPDADGVNKLGLVDNLESAYEIAGVVVNPMLYGTGLKIKNVEALGYSKPLVTSPVGADGLEDISGYAFLVAEEPEEFSAHVVKLLTDQELNKTLAQRAYESACNWNKDISAQLDQALRTLPPDQQAFSNDRS